MIDAVKDILGRAVVEVRKNAFDFDNSDGRTLNWTPIQFWTIMKQLAASETVGFYLFPSAVFSPSQPSCVILSVLTSPPPFLKTPQ